jgi:HEAT repeat protein
MVACNVEVGRARKTLLSPDPMAREEALETLAEGGEPADARLVVPLLRDSSARVRKKAVAALGSLGFGPYLRKLAGCLNDSDLEVRLATVRVLGDSGKKAAHPVLLLALRDPSMIVRRSAAAALEALGMSPADQVKEQAREELEEQVKRLSRADDQLRATAARMVGLSGQPQAVELLRPLLADPSPLVVREAAGAIGRIGGASAAEDLMELAGDRRARTRLAAAVGLTEAGGPRSLATLIKLSGDPDRSVKQAALEGLARLAGGGDLGGVEGGGVICKAVASGEVEVAQRAAAVLQAVPTLTCTEEVQSLYHKAQSGGSQLYPVLSALGTERARAELLRLAQQAYMTYRRGAVKWIAPDGWRALAEGRPSSAPVSARPKRHRSQALARLLSKFPERVSGTVIDPLLPPPVEAERVTRMIEALGGHGSSRPWLAEVASEAPRGIRVAALVAIAGVPAAGAGGTAARAVQLGLRSKSESVRAAALKACPVLGHDRALEEALKMLEDKDFDVRSEAATCLGRLQDHRAVMPLLSLLRREHPLAAIVALARIGDRRATAPLLELLQEDHPAGRQDERVVVVEALGELGDRTAVSAVGRELSNPQWRVRIAAARALGRMGGDGSVAETLALCMHDYYAEVRATCQDARQAAQGKAASSGSTQPSGKGPR